MGWQHAGLHPQRAESFCNLKLPHLAQSLHLGEVFLPVFRPFGSKLAVQGRYNQNLFHRVLSRSLQGIAERPLSCNYNVIQPAFTAVTRVQIPSGTPIQCLGRRTFYSLSNETIGNHGVGEH